MYKRNVYIQEIYTVSEGISHIQRCGCNQKYKHGHVADTYIYSSNGTGSAWIVGEDTLALLNSWGLIPPKLGNLGQITAHIQMDPSKTWLTTEKIMDLRYKCNSREIFKPLNELIKNIKAIQRLSPSTTSKFNSLASVNSLATSLIYDTPEQSLAKAENWGFYHTRIILDTPKFRHQFKLIHPNTEIYHD